MVPPTSPMLLAAAPALFALSQTEEANPSGDHFAHLAHPKIGSTDAFQRCLKRLRTLLANGNTGRTGALLMTYNESCTFYLIIERASCQVEDAEHTKLVNSCAFSTRNAIRQ